MLVSLRCVCLRNQEIYGITRYWDLFLRCGVSDKLLLVLAKFDGYQLV